MATIHKLTKDGATIFPATITDAVVHPNTGKTLTSMIKDYNVSELFPSEGIDGGNKYNLALAISVLGTHLTAAEKTGGIKLTFISSVTGYPEEEYFLLKNTWSTNTADWGQRFEVGDVIADPSGSWTPSTAEAYIDQQVAGLNTTLTGEISARITGDNNLQTQIQSEMGTRADQDANLNALINAGIREGGGVQFDIVPTQNSANGITSGGMYSTLRDPNVGFVDANPTAGSDNLVKSGGTKKELNKVVPAHYSCVVGSNVFRYDFKNEHAYIVQNNTSQSINVRVGDNSNIDHYQNAGNIGAGKTKEFTVDNNYTYQYLYIYSNEANSDAVVLYDKNYYIEEIESLHQKDDELDAGKLDTSTIKVSIISNNIFDAQHNLLLNTLVDNIGDIGSAEGWQTAKIAVKEGDVITYGRFSLRRSGYAAYYLGSTKVSYWTFNDPEGGVCETLTVPSGVDTLYVDMVSPMTIGHESPYFTANYGAVLKEWDEYEEAITEIDGHKIAGITTTQNLSFLVVDLPVSDGTDIDSGYAYIDSTVRTVKVKA